MRRRVMQRTRREQQVAMIAARKFDPRRISHAAAQEDETAQAAAEAAN